MFSFVHFTEENYVKADYNILEGLMVKQFDWDLNVPTLATFVSYYIEFVVDESDFNDKCPNKMFNNFDDFQKDIKSRVMDLVDDTVFGMIFLSLLHYSFHMPYFMYA